MSNTEMNIYMFAVKKTVTHKNAIRQIKKITKSCRTENHNQAAVTETARVLTRWADAVEEDPRNSILSLSYNTIRMVYRPVLLHISYCMEAGVHRSEWWTPENICRTVLINLKYENQSQKEVNLTHSFFHNLVLLNNPGHREVVCYCGPMFPEGSTLEGNKVCIYYDFETDFTNPLTIEGLRSVGTHILGGNTAA